MKKPLLLLAAASTLVGAVAISNDAQAGHVSLNIHIGVPVPAYRPRVVYEPIVYPPVVAYRPRLIHPPRAIYYRPAYHEHRYHGWGRGYASAYPSYQGHRRFAEGAVHSRSGR